jgi:hypothetical protein
MCIVQIIHHLTPYVRRNSPVQFVCSVLLFGASITLLLDDYGAGNINYKQFLPWDFGWLVLILGCDLWSCIYPVSVNYYQYMNAEYSAGLWSYFNFNWYTYVIDIGYERSIQTDDLPVLIDDDRTISVWKRFSKLLYTRGQNNVINGEDLKIGRRVMNMSGYRLYLQVNKSYADVSTVLLCCAVVMCCDTYHVYNRTDLIML